MAAVLKIKCQDQVHRVVLPDGPLTYEVVQEALCQVYPGGVASAKYLDDENDLCTLWPASFSDFVSMCGEQNGRKILKLEVIANEPAKQPTSSEANEQPQSNAFAHEGWSRGGTEGWRGGWKGGCKGGHHTGKPKQILFALAMLRKSGLLNAKSAAALAVNSLPQFLSHVADRPEKFDWKVKQKLTELTPFMEDLCKLVGRTQGLDHCENVLASVMKSDETPPSEAILELLTSLDALTFDAQILFFEAFYQTQEERFVEVFAKAHEHMSWMPSMPLEHAGVVCDGCGATPVKGLRFNCKTCPNYDLCAECYTNKGAVHSNECSTHEFEMTMPADTWAAKMAMWGARMVGKAFGKGGEWWTGKGHHGHHGEGHHGHRGERGHHQGRHHSKGKGKCWGKRPFEESAGGEQECPHTENDAVRADEVPGAAHMRDHELYFDLAFPVVVEDGRRLTIAWNKTDDLSEVAAAFAAEHGIPQDELLTIQAFVEHASAASASDSSKQPQEESDNTMNSDLEQALKQLQEMGLGDAEVLLELLKSNGGNVQKVIESLAQEWT